MTQKEYNHKLDEVVSRFKNGRELYNKSALFNQIVQVLIREDDPYAVIEHLVQANTDTQKAFISYVERDTRPMYFNH
jgi:hypothetical protein